VTTIVVAKAQDALESAARAARRAGLTPAILGHDVQGEAREVARDHARLALRTARGEGPVAPPCVLLSGGETTVALRGRGPGGRNGEYLLALALELGGHPGIHAFAGDTDGLDGSGGNAGYLLAPDSLPRAANAGLEAHRCLAGNESYRFFAALGDLVVTGPTGTNVSDFRAILVSEAGSPRRC
jgi:hydroxypyruvate reductase